MARYVDIECNSVTEVIGRRSFKSRADIQEFLDNIPTADVVEVKHGEWKWNRGQALGEKSYFCSLCTDGESDTGNDKYCPNCGAKMDGGKAE